MVFVKSVKSKSNKASDFPVIKCPKSETLEETDSDSDRENVTCTKVSWAWAGNKSIYRGASNEERYLSFLDSKGIVVMQESNKKAIDFLHRLNGRLTKDLDPQLLEELRDNIPSHLGAARVADFNENLSYAMSPERGLRSAFCQSGRQTEPTCTQQRLILEFEQLLHSNMNPCGGSNFDSLEYQGSFMRTEGPTIPQPPHVDFGWDYLAQEDARKKVMIGVFPLSQQGCFLQVWPQAKDQETMDGIVVFVPYGSLLLLPCDTIHGGGFRSKYTHPETLGGNERFHLYVSCDGKALPRFQNNRYTERTNPGQELGVRFRNAPCLKSKELISEIFE